jgi:ribosomal protein S19
MSRSIYKPPFVHRCLFSNVLENKQVKENLKMNKIIKTMKITPKYVFFKKNTNININLLDKKLYIYNGKVFVSVYILQKIVGYTLGSFCVTRRKPPHTGKQKQIKKVSRTYERFIKQRKENISK